MIEYISGLQVVKSKLYSKYRFLKYAISTRKGGVSPEPYGLNLSYKVGDIPSRVLENRKRFFNVISVPMDKLAVPKQVHGSKVISISRPGNYDSCDALITNCIDIFLVITIADCIPISLFDPMTNSIAVVHVGWKGSQTKILETTIQTMFHEFETQSKNIITVFGPSASACCYEVGEEVALNFNEKYLKSNNNQNKYLDMKLLNKDILLNSGVMEGNIEISEYCTICNPDLFHSYRRDGINSGRMMCVIGLLSKQL